MHIIIEIVCMASISIVTATVTNNLGASSFKECDDQPANQPCLESRWILPPTSLETQLSPKQFLKTTSLVDLITSVLGLQKLTDRKHQ